MKKPVTEFELIDYATGRLECSPERLREIEEWVAELPELADRVEEYKTQDAVIRQRYDAVLNEPIPERLLSVLEQPRRPRLDVVRLLPQAAVVALLMAASAAGGWYAAHKSTPVNAHLRAFAEGSLLARGAFSDIRSLADIRSESGHFGVLADLLPMHVSQVGPLAEGYSVLGAQQVVRDETVGLRLLLANEAGERAFLFVQGRWNGHDSDIKVASRDDVSLASWEEGPLLFGLAASDGPAQTRELAEAVRDAMRVRLVEQTIQPAPQQQLGVPAEPQAPQTGVQQ